MACRKSSKMNRLFASLLVIAVALVAANAARLQDQSNIFSSRDKTNTIEEEDLSSDEVPSNLSDAKNQTGSNQSPINNNVQANVTALPDFADALTSLLKAFHRVMPCGIESLGIPVLAPFRIPHIDVNVSEELLTLKGEIKDLVIAGLENSLLINLATNSSNNRTTFDYMYKDIHILGHANIHVAADLAGYKFVHDIKGALDFEIVNLRVTGGVTIGRNSDGGMLFSDLEYYIQVSDIISNILDTEWSVAVNNFVNNYLSDMSKLFLQTNRDFLSDLVSGYVTPLANTAFQNVSSTEYVQAMVEATQLYNDVACVA